MDRTLSFAGGCNFRELGGYLTRDGRQLKWGRVYRTGVLSYFTPEDHERLKMLGVRVICDLRRADERRQQPTRWLDATTQHLSWEDGSAPPTIRSVAAKCSHHYTALGMRAAMIDLYRELPQWMAPRLRGLFLRIAQGEVPILVHCAAGKDRTGIAIALLLALLHVPHETILEDYLLTNACDVLDFTLRQHKAQHDLTSGDQPLLAMPDDIRDVLFAAHSDYLNAAFDQMALDHGGAHDYLRNEVGLNEDMISNVQAMLLST